MPTLVIYTNANPRNRQPPQTSGPPAAPPRRRPEREPPREYQSKSSPRRAPSAGIPGSPRTWRRRGLRSARSGTEPNAPLEPASTSSDLTIALAAEHARVQPVHRHQSDRPLPPAVARV